MLKYLYGSVISVSEETVCLDVSGFGLEVFASGSLLAKASEGNPLDCLAWMQVSESGLSLFGFTDELERALFLELMQVKTMGGKLSIALMRHVDAGAIINAIASDDVSRLTVPGLGAKRAERICFELRPKIEKKFSELINASALPGPRRDAGVSGVIAGLVGLGFSQAEANRAVGECRSESGGAESWTEESLLMAALAKLKKI